MSRLVTIYGGSGFVGRYVTRRMAREGWRVRVACRRPNEAIFVRPYGTVGQVEPVLCNIRDDNSVRGAMRGVDAVVNCVGTFDIKGKNNVDAVQAEGAERIARIAAESGVSNLVHISAMGADIASMSDYSRTKAEGEAAVLRHFENAMILRPSVIFGHDDNFLNRFAAMSRMGPLLPVVGADTKFQPVYVEDVAQAVQVHLTSGKFLGTYELGGPEVCSLRDILQNMLGVIRRRKLLVNIPFGAAGVMAAAFDGMSSITLGLFKNSILTRDQVRMLKQDNIAAKGSNGLAELGIEPTAMVAVLPEYLWRFRPAGQYDAIKESAGNLKA